MLCSSLAWGKERSWSVFLDLSSEYNDNIYWQKENKQDDWINRIMPGININLLQPHMGINLNYTAGFESFAHNSSQNTTSHDAKLNAFINPSGHLSLNLNESYSRSTNLAEVDIYGVNRRRETYWQNNVSPSFKFIFGENRSIYGAYRYNITHFSRDRTQNSTEHTASGGIVYGIDFRNTISLDYSFTHGEFSSMWGNLNGHRVNLSYYYKLTPHTDTYLSGSYSLRQYTQRIDYTVYSSVLGIKHAFSPRLACDLNGGTYFYKPEGAKTTKSFSGQINLTYLYKHSQLTVTAVKGVRETLFTTLNLGLNTYWGISINLNHKLSPHLSSSIGTSYNKSHYKYVERSDKFWTASFRLEYNPITWFRGYVAYTYSTLNTNEALGGYDVNHVIVGLRFIY